MSKRESWRSRSTTGRPRICSRGDWIGSAAESPSAPASKRKGWSCSTWPGGSIRRFGSSPSTPGGLHQETYEIIEVVRKRYGVAIEVHSPDAGELEAMTRKHGVNLFYQAVPLRLLCCQVRKVRPLQRVLDGLDAWITGLRRETWASRADIRKIELDHEHGGIAKLNPLADWTHEEVWDYLRANEVPYHPLYDQGFTSIGCAPCTRRTAPGEDPRAGRWWWEKNAPKECGMHCTIETGGFEHELEVLVERSR
jgi:phosphoadenylyl-sulfate reductase (thioredoxin)